MTKDEVFSLQKEQAKGREASNLALSIEKYFETAKENLLASYLKSDPNNSERHTAIRRQIEAVDAVWSLLQNEINTGKMATITLEQEK